MPTWSISTPTIQRIAPCLWFDGRAEEAATFYTAIFKDSRIGAISGFGELDMAALQRSLDGR
jgi:predicted 3-demethylubiquinone-9 3-methyltransferase (glyoxalase superfamily)